MDFEIKEKQLTANIYGKSYPYKKPKLGQVERLQTEIEAAVPSKQIAIMRSFASGCGFPEDVLNEMGMDDFLQLIEALTDVKKK